MDPITHSLAGTLIGRTQTSAKKGLVAACVMGAVIPDIDIVLTLWGKSFYMLEHRGFTHSFVGILPMALLARGWFGFSSGDGRTALLFPSSGEWPFGGFCPTFSWMSALPGGRCCFGP